MTEPFPRLADPTINPGCKWIVLGDYYDCLHNAGTRGTSIEDCCESCRELVLRGITTLADALSRHDRWCGHYADAPGDAVVVNAQSAARWMADWSRYQQERA